MLRALRAEACRITSDVALLGCLGLAVLLGASMYFAIPSHTDAVPGAVRGALVGGLTPALLGDAAVIAGIYGAFRYTFDLNHGIVARQAVLGHRLPALAFRGVFAAASGCLIGALGLVIMWAAVCGAIGAVGLPASLLARASLGGGLASLWGLSVGVLIGRHLPSLFMASLSLAVTLPLSQWNEGLASLTPLGAQLSATTGSPWLSASAALCLAVGWVLVFGAAALMTALRRDL